jgi:hypothetical protein
VSEVIRRQPPPARGLILLYHDRPIGELQSDPDRELGRLLKFYEEGLHGYTYLEDVHEQ